MHPRNSSKRDKKSNKSVDRKHRRNPHPQALPTKLQLQLDRVPVRVQHTQSTHFSGHQPAKITDRRPAKSSLTGRLPGREEKKEQK